MCAGIAKKREAPRCEFLSILGNFQAGNLTISIKSSAADLETQIDETVEAMTLFPVQ